MTEAAEALIGLLGGHIDVACLFPTQSTPHIKAGKLRALAVSDSKRDPDFPDRPNAAGKQVLMLSVSSGKGVLAPKATPRPIIDKLALAFKKMSEDKSSVAMIRQLGDNFHYMGPDELTKFWQEEFEASQGNRKSL